MRLLTQPKNVENRVAAEALTYGQFVYIDSNGKFAKPTTSGTALKSKYVIVRPPEMSRAFTGYDNIVKSGEMACGVNGVQVEFYTESINVSDDFANIAPGTALGITNAGLVCATASAASGTTGFLALDSYVGNTSSGVLRANIDFMV